MNTRDEIITAATAAPEVADAWLFEPAHVAPAPFRPVLASGSESAVADAATDIEIPPDSLLLRWLRVNDVVLPVPDRSGLVDSLTPADRGVLARLRIGACVPLVHDANLAGWIALSPVLSSRHFHAHAGSLKQHAAEWAAALERAHQDRARSARSESVRRSNKLTVAGQVAASIAHEVRNPLAAVRAMVQAIRTRDAPPAKHPQMLDDIVSEIDRVTSVLSEVLVLGRDRQPIQEPCDLATVARDAVEFCGSYASGREIRLDTSALRPAPIVGDPDEMRQIFVNLILNACQASPAESTVRMETFQDEREADGGWSIVRFSDAGAGMTPDVIARVFEPFFSTRKDGGGLGLAVCREIVQRHRGAISIESMPGAGTTVTLRLPRRSR